MSALTDEVDKVIDNASAVAGLTLLPWQRDYLRAALSGQPVALVRGRRSGRTTVQRIFDEAQRLAPTPRRDPMSTDSPTPERVTLVGDDLTLVEQIQAEAAACRLLDRHGAAARLDRIATALAAREQAPPEEREAGQRVSAWLDTNWKYVADDLTRDLRLILARIARGGAR